MPLSSARTTRPAAAPFAWIAFGVLLTAPIGGCKDRAPTPPVYRDLSNSEGDPLLPTRGAWKSEAVASGQAEWVPFREPGTKVEPEEDPEESDSGPAPEATEERGGDTEATIRALIAEYNELAKAQKIDEMIEYHVDAQRDTVRLLLESAKGLFEKLQGLRGQLEGKLPAEKSRIGAIFDRLEEQADAGMIVVSITVVSPKEVTGQLPPGMPISTIRFLLDNDEWFVEYPGLPPKEQLAPLLQMGLAGFDTMSQALASGQMPAEQLLQILEQQVAALPTSPSGSDDSAKSEGE